jgi:hypothetical protein
MPPLQWRDAAVAAWRVKRHERRRPLEDWIQRPMRWEAFQCVSDVLMANRNVWNCLRINGDKYTIKDLDLTWFDHQRQECLGDFGVCYVVNLHISWYKLCIIYTDLNLQRGKKSARPGFLPVWRISARLGLRALPIVGMPWQKWLFAPVWWFLRPFDSQVFAPILRTSLAHFFVNS